MKRRAFNILIALAPASGALLSNPSLADAATPDKAAQAGTATGWARCDQSPDPEWSSSYS